MPREREQAIQMARQRAYKSKLDELVNVSGNESAWGLYDQGFSEFAMSFGGLIDSPRLAASSDEAFYLFLQAKREKSLADRPNEPFHYRALEIMGPGSQFFSYFPDGFFSETYGVTLLDHRSPALKDQDRQRGHTVLEYDVNDPHFWQDLSSLAGQQGFDLVLYRPIAAKYDLPNNAFVQFDYLSKLYEQMCVNSTLLAENSIQFRPLVFAWERLVQQQPGMHCQTSAELFVRLDKLAGAPDSLPALSTREIIANPQYKDALERIKLHQLYL